MREEKKNNLNTICNVDQVEKQPNSQRKSSINARNGTNKTKANIQRRALHVPLRKCKNITTGILITISALNVTYQA